MFEAITAAKFLVPAGAGLALGVIVGLGIGYTWGHSNGYDEGRIAAIADVRQQDDKAVGAADAGRSAVARCRAIGGLWDQSSGKCGGG